METNRCTLHLERTSSKDIRIRDLYLIVNDEPEFTLLFGESMEMGLEPGPHRLKITNRLFTKRVEFALADGETARYEVANVPGGCLFAPLMVISGTGAYRVAISRKQEPG